MEDIETGGHWELVKQLVVQRLQLLYDLDLNVDHTPQELVKAGLLDPVKLFIKNDPHKLKKIEEHKERLICSVSLIDNLIARLLFGPQNKAEIDAWETTPSKPGMGLHDEGIAIILETVKSALDSFGLFSTDVSGWDWSFTETDFHWDLERRIMLADGDNPVWEKLARSHFHVMARKVFLLSDGRMFEQLHPGVMPSGWYNTSSTNSACRVMLAWYVQIVQEIQHLWAIAMGDDCIERGGPRTEEIYRQLNRPLKVMDSICPKGVFEFCSHSFNFVRRNAIPANIGKLLYNLFRKPVTEDRISGFEFAMRHYGKGVVDTAFHLLRAIPGPGKMVPLLGAVNCLGLGHLDGYWVPSCNGPKSLCSANQNAKRLHGAPAQVAVDLECTVPISRISASNTNMSKLNKPAVPKKPQLIELMAQVGALKAQVRQQKEEIAKKRATPFTTSGGKIGEEITQWVGMPSVGRHVGRFLGAGIGSIFGSGNYKVTGGARKYNVFSGQIPKFANKGASNVVCHREYIGDISTTTAFTIAKYPIQPGLASGFPWLSTVANRYSEYKFHGVIYEFRSLTTDYSNSGTPGYINFATNYDADAAAYATKQQMDNSEFAVSTKPTKNLAHMIECDRKQAPFNELYVRNGTQTSYKNYDLGNLFVATGGASSAIVVGELWVTYCVEFFKPIISPASVQSASMFKYSATGGSGTNCWGTQAYASGSLSVTLNTNAFTITGLVPNVPIFVQIGWTGTSAACTWGGVTLSNGFATVGDVNNNTSTYLVTPNATTTQFFYTSVITQSSGKGTWTLASSTLPTNANVDLMIAVCDATIQ